MPISRPRRIFRPALPGRGLAAAAIAAILVAGGVAMAMLPFRSGSPSPVVASGGDRLDASASQVAVVDAGTLRLRNRTVRLLGVEPPARGANCTGGDGNGFDCGAAATNALAALVRETPVACEIRGHDDFGRAVAVCDASGTELNRAVVEAGWARADASSPALQRAEAAARADHRGLWAARAQITW